MLATFSTARRARASTLPARFKDYVHPETDGEAAPRFDTWSENSSGRKRGRADRGLMSVRELAAAFADSQPPPAPAPEIIDTNGDALADVLFSEATSEGPCDLASCLSPCNTLANKQLRRSPPHSPTDEIDTLAMLEALVSEESLLAPPAYFHDSPRHSADGEDDDDEAFADEVSSLFQLMGADDTDAARTPFEMLAEPEMLLGAVDGMPALPLLPPPPPPTKVLPPQQLPATSMNSSMARAPAATPAGSSRPPAAPIEISVVPPASAVPPQPLPVADHGADAVMGAATATAAQLADKGAAATRNVAERKEWTTAEDELIRSSVEQYGCKWRVIAAQLPGRSDDAVRNRWNRLREAQAPKLTFADGVVLGGEGTLGGEGLVGVVPPKAVRKPSRGSSSGSSVDGESSKPERVSWSRQEDETIVQSVGEFGHKWGRIAQRLPGRTEHAIRNRYSRLQSLLEHDKRPAQLPLALPIAAC